MVFIVALALWPPFQFKGHYEGQHFLFDPAYAFAHIDLTRLGIGWLSIVLTFGIVFLLLRSLSLRALKVFGLTVASLLFIVVAVVLVVKEIRRNAHTALTRQAREALAAVTITNRPEENFVLSNPTDWDLYAEWPLNSSFTIDYLNPDHLILFGVSHYQHSSPVRPHSQQICEKVSPTSLPREQQSQLPQGSPFVQRVTFKYDRAAISGSTVEFDPPLELIAERYFVFYPEQWGWDDLTHTSYLRGAAEFKEVSANTRQAPPRRLAGPPSQRGRFKLSDIDPDPLPDFLFGKSPRVTPRGETSITDQMDRDLRRNSNARRRP
jgi:hypothetical protein